MNFFTYEVIAYNNQNEAINKKEFNTQLESKVYFQICTEENDFHCVQQIKVTNHEKREVIREHHSN